MRNFIIAGLIVLSGTFARGAFLTIADPGFEQDDRSDNNDAGYGPISSWDGTGSAGTNINTQPFNSPTAVPKTIPEGSLIAFIQGVGEISQSVAGFVNGQQYQLGYYQNSRGNSGVPARVEVDLGGTVIDAAHDVASTQDYGHPLINFTYTGPTGSALLELKSLNAATNSSDDNTALFDLVSIQEVPEPTSLMLLGLGGFGLLSHGRRSR